MIGVAASIRCQFRALDCIRGVLITTLLTVALPGCDRSQKTPETLTRAADWDGSRMGMDFSTHLPRAVRPVPEGNLTATATTANARPTPFQEGGAFFDHLDSEPTIYRSTVEVCPACWVVAEVATRRSDAASSEFLSIVQDPEDPSNPVLRLRTREHTDGVILRSRMPLPENYRISFRIGYIEYGSEHSLNGYDSGDESALPWVDQPAVGHNGVYWMTIMDTRPAPHNNIWGHHHRKFFIDAWNTKGRLHGVTVAGVDGLASTHPRFGKSFIAHNGKTWQAGATDPAFFYKLFTWYTVSLTRRDDVFNFRITGDFKNAATNAVSGEISARDSCLYHYNRTPESLDAKCLTGEGIRVGALVYPAWPSDGGYPDYFMMGDPHINYYEGSVLIDDLVLEVL